MGINALTSAIATPTTPAMALTGGQRGSLESVSASTGSNAAPSSVPRVVFNPRSHFDASAGVFVMEYRSASSGEIERQFPDEQQLRAYENAKKLEGARNKGESPASAIVSPFDLKASTTAEPSKGASAERPVDSGKDAARQPVRIEV